MWVLLFFALQSTNPYTSVEDVATGREMYRRYCSECHGIGGEGGRGPNLADGEFFHGGTDDALFRTVKNGIPGTEMPAYFRSDKSTWQVIAFLRSLSQAEDLTELTGDADRGRELFRTKGDCLQCHRVGTEGGFAGPDLSSVGSRRSLEHLRTALVEPSEEVRPRYWTAKVTDRSGQETTGFILNQDRHTMQLLDFDGELRSVSKEGAAIEIERGSMMQSYEGIFDDEEMNDLLTYLASLRRARK